MNIDDLLKVKPSKETIFNSIRVKNDYWQEACKQQIKLNKQQEKERQKLMPTEQLLKLHFTI